MDYIQGKIKTLRMEPVLEPQSQVNAFKIKLLEHALTPEDELQRLYQEN